MAEMYPPLPPVARARAQGLTAGPGSHAEQLVYLALRDSLPSDWFVYHHVPFVEIGAAAAGEADFLVLHPAHGLLVIECKGAGVSYTAQAGWQRLRADGTREPLKKGPAEQAQDTVKALVKALNARLPAPVPLVHGHAVAFPLVRANAAAWPLDLPRLLVLDAEELARFGQRIPEILAFWRKAAPHPPAAMSAEAFRKFRKHALHPELKLVPDLGAQLAAEAAALCRLSEEQVRVIESLMDMPAVRVDGGAGTGKTMLALEAARMLAATGGQVLLVCFNNALGRHLERSIAAMDVGPGTIKATSFHRLCREAALAMGRPFDVPEGESKPFWRQEAALLLYEAIDAGRLGPWDALIVDEAQDFADGWWTALEAGLRMGPTTRRLAFADPAQSLFENGGAPPDWQIFRLTRNYRNTRCIAEVLARLDPRAARPDERAPEGEPPEVHVLESPSKLRRQLDDQVDRLVRQGVVPERMAILTPHTRPNSSLNAVTDLGGVPLVDRPDQRDQGLLHTTIGAFKGLEADVVLLADVRPEDPRCSRGVRYVAASRARHRLHVYATGDWLA